MNMSVVLALYVSLVDSLTPPTKWRTWGLQLFLLLECVAFEGTLAKEKAR